MIPGSVKSMPRMPFTWRSNRPGVIHAQRSSAYSGSMHALDDTAPPSNDTSHRPGRPGMRPCTVIDGNPQRPSRSAPSRLFRPHDVPAVAEAGERGPRGAQVFFAHTANQDARHAEHGALERDEEPSLLEMPPDLLGVPFQRVRPDLDREPVRGEGEHFDGDPGGARADHVDLLGSRPREVDDPPLDERAPVVDLHHGRPAIGEVGHLDQRAEGQGLVGRGEEVGVEHLAARGEPALELAAVPRGQTLLQRERRGNGRDDECERERLHCFDYRHPVHFIFRGRLRRTDWRPPPVRSIEEAPEKGQVTWHPRMI